MSSPLESPLTPPKPSSGSTDWILLLFIPRGPKSLTPLFSLFPTSKLLFYPVDDIFPFPFLPEVSLSQFYEQPPGL